MKKILITSIGRTGTTSLTSYLNTISGVSSFHEKEKRDIQYLFLSTSKEYSIVSDSYLKKRIIIDESFRDDFYIEVNPYLRFANLKILKDEGWKVLFLVRDPKTYLESVFTRSLFNSKDYLLQQLPNNNDPIAQNWEGLSRFQKLCWYYFKVHEYIINSNLKYYHYEDIIKNRNVLIDLLDHIGISKQNVEHYILPKKNTSSAYILRSKIVNFVKGEKSIYDKLIWENLTKDEEVFYEKYCQKLGKKMGY